MCWLFLINSLALVIVFTIARDAFLAFSLVFPFFAFFAARQLVGKNRQKEFEREKRGPLRLVLVRDCGFGCCICSIHVWESSFKPSLHSLNLTEGKHYFESLGRNEAMNIRLPLKVRMSMLALVCIPLSIIIEECVFPMDGASRLFPRNLYPLPGPSCLIFEYSLYYVLAYPC